MTRSRLTGWVVGLVFVMGSGFPAFGQSAHASSDGWRFTIAPYMWMMGIDGDITVKGRKADVDVGFDDIWSNLDFGGMLHLEAQKGRWGVFFDPTYAELSVENGTPLGTIETESSLFMAEVGALFRAGEWPGTDPQKGPVCLEIIGGGRYWDLTGKIRFPRGSTFGRPWIGSIPSSVCG